MAADRIHDLPEVGPVLGDWDVLPHPRVGGVVRPQEDRVEQRRRPLPRPHPGRDVGEDRGQDAQGVPGGVAAVAPDQDVGPAGVAARQEGRPSHPIRPGDGTGLAEAELGEGVAEQDDPGAGAGMGARGGGSHGKDMSDGWILMVIFLGIFTQRIDTPGFSDLLQCLRSFPYCSSPTTDLREYA